MKVLHGRHLTLFLDNGMEGRKKSMFQSGLIDLGRERPTQPSSLNTGKVVFDSPSPNIEASSDLAGRETFFIMKT
jgi:hypothetical protein